MDKLCDKGVLEDMNGKTYLKCTIFNGFCPYIRLCSNDSCIKMLQSFTNCKFVKI